MLPSDGQLLRLPIHDHALDGQEFRRKEIHPVHVVGGHLVLWREDKFLNFFFFLED